MAVTFMQDAKDTPTMKAHPYLVRFQQMKLVRRSLVEDEQGNLVVEEIRRCETTGERQRLTFTLDPRNTIS